MLPDPSDYPTVGWSHLYAAESCQLRNFLLRWDHCQSGVRTLSGYVWLSSHLPEPKTECLKAYNSSLFIANTTTLRIFSSQILFLILWDSSGNSFDFSDHHIYFYFQKEIVNKALSVKKSKSNLLLPYFQCLIRHYLTMCFWWKKIENNFLSNICIFQLIKSTKQAYK